MIRTRRLGVIVASASLSFGLIALTGGTAAHATGLSGAPLSSCTYSDAATASSSTAAIVVNPGDSVTITCSGLPANQSLVIAEASPLAGVLAQPATLTQSEAVVDVAAANIGGCSSDAAGNLVTGLPTSTTLGCTFAVPSPFVAGDSDAVCPPTQTQINDGLTTCALAVATATGAQFNDAGLIYPSQLATPPAAPTLKLSNTVGAAGDSIAVTDQPSPSGFWWGAGITGSPNAGLFIPAPFATVGGVPASSNLQVSPAVYTENASSTAGVLTPPAITGTITIPSGLTAGANPVVVDEINTTPYTGNAATGIIPGTKNVEASTPFTLLGAPSIQLNPTQGGNGTTVTVTGSNWDPQGSAVGITGLAAPGSGTVNSAGNLTGSISVTAGDIPGPVMITGTQTGAAGPLTANAPFTVLAANAGPSATDGSTPVKLNQVISETVTGVTQGLIASEAATGTNPDATDVTLTGATLNGVNQVAHGTLNTVTIVDERGTLVGWSATSILETDFIKSPPSVGSNAWDHVIPGDLLSWTPGLSIPVTNGLPDGVASEITVGSPTVQGQFPVTSQTAGLGAAGTPYTSAYFPEPTNPIFLCSAAAGGGGGTFQCGATLSLAVPAYVAAGTYTSTIDIIVI